MPRSISRSLALGCLLTACLTARDARAVDRLVGTTGAFATALGAAQPGDTISLIPGVYDGGHSRTGLTDVVIRRQPGAEGEVVIRGGVNGIQLSDATRVTLEHLTFEAQTGNGLNIDDGGSFATPSTDVTLRDLVVRDMNASGNNDGVKLSGVTGFLIERVEVTNWGASGSAIDPVGSHHGVIQNSLFRSDTLSDNGSVIRPKGGSKDITVRANLVDLPTGVGRAMQAGGSTGAPFFRFVDGDSGYEAADIRFYGNRVLGGASAMNWVNIQGGLFHHNDVRGPTRWAIRILNENQSGPIVDTAGGVFTDNYVAYDGDSWSRAVNVGPEVDAGSFAFARNKWLNTADPTPAGSTVSLPTPEAAGEPGVAAPWGAGEPMRWGFPWGEWVVPLESDGAAVPVAGHHELLYARPLEGARFDPLAADPLSGDWLVRPAAAVETTDARHDFVLILPDACALCQTGLPGDYDRNGVVNAADRDYWSLAYGYEGAAPLADGNGDGRVDAADYTLWRDAYEAANATAAPEPGAAWLAALAWLLSRPRGGIPPLAEGA